MEKNILDRFSGVVVFLRSDIGSKSESMKPYLYQGRDIPLLPIRMKNDNPFENSSLVKFDGRRVIVHVVQNESRAIVDHVESI